MDSVHEVEFKSNENEAEVAMADLVRALRRAVEVQVGVEAPFKDREVTALGVANEASRQYFEQELQRMSDSYEDEILIDGVLHRRSHDLGRGMYHSLCGPLHPYRAPYRPVGGRNGPTVVPLELEAGIAEGATPALAYNIVHGYANETSRLYQEQMGTAHRKVPSRSTVERIGKALGKKAKEAAPSIERYLRQSEGVPEGTVAMSLGLDRTSVPYEEERAEGEPPKTRRKKRTKPYVRKPPSPVDVNYHMAYVGTVSFVDCDGEFLATRKYAATHHDGPDDIVVRMMADVRAAKLRKPELNVGLVQDGGPEMWNLMRRALDGEDSVEEYKEGIDRYHLSERLGKVLKVTEEDPDRRSELFEQWTNAFDEDDETIDRIEEYIGALVWDCETDDGQELLLDNLTFIENNGDRMRYVALREAGLPIGSGATEGACKSLVSCRAKRSGQRWHNKGVAAVLTLRAIHQSERLPRFWGHLSRRYTAMVEKAAA